MYNCIWIQLERKIIVWKYTVLLLKKEIKIELKKNHFKQLLSRECQQQTGWLPQWLFIVDHFKKETITSPPVGHGESGR